MIYIGGSAMTLDAYSFLENPIIFLVQYHISISIPGFTPWQTNIAIEHGYLELIYLLKVVLLIDFP